MELEEDAKSQWSDQKMKIQDINSDLYQKANKCFIEKLQNNI